MRSVDELIDSGLEVIRQGTVASGNWRIERLFSGGHDSLVATHLASLHPKCQGHVHHIDTGIGSQYTRRFVERVCDRFGWNLKVWKSKSTYERFVRERGFPGPGRHGWVYNRLKDHCVCKIVRGPGRRVLVTGCRSQESVRRMGFVVPVQIGEVNKHGQRVKLRRVWAAPCHDWSKAEQMAYMEEFGLPVNKLKVALGLSGECFCGAFAQPGERELIRKYAPDVEQEIVRLTAIAEQCGTHSEWGTRPQKGQCRVAATGPMCSSCDQRASAKGIEIVTPH